MQMYPPLFLKKKGGGAESHPAPEETLCKPPQDESLPLHHKSALALFNGACL